MVDLDVHLVHRARGDDHLGTEVVGALGDLLDLRLVLLRFGEGECAATAGDFLVVLLDQLVEVLRVFEQLAVHTERAVGLAADIAGDLNLSDGKPDDYDGYRGDYGIENTRQALIEVKRDGIHPFCVTIDTKARNYLPHLYGAVNWALVEDVKKLPVKVSDIYRRLTA